MRHPLENLIRSELLALAGVMVIFMFHLWKGFTILFFLAFYLLAFSIVCRAMMSWLLHEKQMALIQGAQSLLLFLLTTYLLFAS